MPRPFNDYDYTRDAIIKQLSLIELHGKDGSAVDAGCACIETKHTYMLEGLSEEMVGFAKSKAEQEFYAQLSDLARNLRKKIDSEDWSLPQKSANPLTVECAQKMAKCIQNGSSFTECKTKVKCVQ